MSAARPEVAQPSSWLAELANGARSVLKSFLEGDERVLSKALSAMGAPFPRGKFELLDGLLSGRRNIPPFAVKLRSTEAPEVVATSHAGEFRWQAVFTLRDSADPKDTVPYRAVMVSDPPGHKTDRVRWLLISIESQCLSCFGAGVVEREQRPCDTCGAVGWGDIQTEPYRV